MVGMWRLTNPWMDFLSQLPWASIAAITCYTPILGLMRLVSSKWNSIPLPPALAVSALGPVNYTSKEDAIRNLAQY